MYWVLASSWVALLGCSGCSKIKQMHGPWWKNASMFRGMPEMALENRKLVAPCRGGHMGGRKYIKWHCLPGLPFSTVAKESSCMGLVERMHLHLMGQSSSVVAKESSCVGLGKRMHLGLAACQWWPRKMGSWLCWADAAVWEQGNALSFLGSMHLHLAACQ